MSHDDIFEAETLRPEAYTADTMPCPAFDAPEDDSGVTVQPLVCRRQTWRAARGIPAPGESLEPLATEYVSSGSRLAGDAYVLLSTGRSLDAYISAGSPYAQWFVGQGEL